MQASSAEMLAADEKMDEVAAAVGARGGGNAASDVPACPWFARQLASIREKGRASECVGQCSRGASTASGQTPATPVLRHLAFSESLRNNLEVRSSDVGR